MTPEGAAALKKTDGGTVSTKRGIVVLDFGGQYTQLIARRIREQQVFSAILPCTASIEEIREQEPVGIVLSGGPSSVYDADAPMCDPKVLALAVPVLGICYGMQWMTHTLGGKVERADRREYGPAHLDIEKSSPLFKGFPARLKIWNSHGDHVAGLARWISRDGPNGQCRGCRGASGQEVLRRGVSSRSESHRPRQRRFCRILSSIFAAPRRIGIAPDSSPKWSRKFASKPTARARSAL